jgi:hypothetical protein
VLLLDIIPLNDDSLKNSFNSNNMQYMLASNKSDILKLLLIKLRKKKLKLS